MNDLNYIQMAILKELLFKPKARFSQLNILRLSSDQFSYHLGVLLETKYLTKEDGIYSLTPEGKEFANRMDVTVNKIEKQPKISVLIIPVKEFDEVEKYLIQKRLKDPYFGFMGFMTGKLRFGETIEEGAARELFEEAGLTAKFKHCYILHEMVYSKSGDLLEDKFFNVVEATDVKGEIVNELGTENSWVSKDEFYSATPLFHNEIEIFEWYKNNGYRFKEKKYYIDTF
jgi:8-oxo-dGTP pyrophosphatase MutT (NUDIX family)